jgi:DNA-binding beta-propeller fold protein YncE
MRKTIKVAVSLSCALLLAGIFVNRSEAKKPGDGKSSGFHVMKTNKLGGDGGWDYIIVDGAARRLYISRSTRVMVIDTDSGSSVGEISPTKGVHGIALAPDLGRGFTSNGADNTATIFDLKTLKVIGTAKTGNTPDAIIYDPASHRAFTFNGRSNDATAIDGKTGEVAGTIPLGGRPEFAAADGKGNVFVNIEDKNEVVAIDSKKLTVKSRWPLAPGEEPTGMAIDTKNHRLFIGCGGNEKMIVMDSENGKVVADLPIGKGCDATGFDPATGTAFSSNGQDGTLTVIHEDSPDKFTVVENATTQRGARTMAVDTKTHHVFLVTAEFTPPPAATTENPRPRPGMVPGSFTVLEVGK